MRPKLLFISACAGMLVFGIVVAILGTVFGMPEMRVRLHASLAQQGDMFFLLYLGIFISSLAVGPLIDHIGNKYNLVASSVLVMIAMVWFALAGSVASASAAAILLGFGGGGLNTCANVLVSDLYVEKRGAMLNLLGVFFGVGAMCIPLLAASIEGRFSISELFLMCASLSGTCTVAYALVSFPPPRATHAFSWRGTLRVAKYPGLLLLAFILFFEAGNEACIGGWVSTYGNGAGFSPRVATLVLAGYWAALMLVRMVAGTVLRVIGKAQLVLICAVLSLAGCAILLSAHSLVTLSAGAVLIGASFAPIFPTTLAIAGDRYASAAGTVFGLLFSIALSGGMVLPWGVGQVSQRFGVRSGMVIPLLGAVGISVLSAIALAGERSLATANAKAVTPVQK